MEELAALEMEASDGGGALFSLAAKKESDTTDEERCEAELERQKSLRPTEQAKKFPYNDTVIFGLPELLECVDTDDMGLPGAGDWNDYDGQDNMLNSVFRMNYELHHEETKESLKLRGIVKFSGQKDARDQLP